MMAVENPSSGEYSGELEAMMAAASQAERDAAVIGAGMPPGHPLVCPPDSAATRSPQHTCTPSLQVSANLTASTNHSGPTHSPAEPSQPSQPCSEDILCSALDAIESGSTCSWATVEPAQPSPHSASTRPMHMPATAVTATALSPPPALTTADPAAESRRAPSSSPTVASDDEWERELVAACLLEEGRESRNPPPSLPLDQGSPQSPHITGSNGSSDPATLLQHRVVMGDVRGGGEATGAAPPTCLEEPPRKPLGPLGRLNDAEMCTTEKKKAVDGVGQVRASSAHTAAGAPARPSPPLPPNPPKRPRRVLPAYLVQHHRHLPKKQAVRTLGVSASSASLQPKNPSALYAATLPVVRWDGPVIVCTTVADAEIKCAALLREAPAGPFGFDIEWKVTFVRGEGQRSTALLQLAGETTVVLFRLCLMPAFPPALRALLEDPTIVVSGVGIHGDVLKLHRDFGVSVRGGADLIKMAERRIVVAENSLEYLCRKLMTRRLPKDGRVRCGNWEAAVLSPEQRKYAALDAVVSLQLFHAVDAISPMCFNSSPHSPRNDDT